MVRLIGNAGVAELADAQDLKSWDLKKSYGFKSHHRYQFMNFKSTWCKVTDELPDNDRTVLTVGDFDYVLAWYFYEK